eukprot:7400120-Lingulodinium_polyedra.AAC.1
MARVTHPLAAKSALQIQVPLVSKGGLLVDFYKGKGDPSQLASQRAILLGPCHAKLTDKAAAGSITGPVGCAVPETFCGGHRRRGTDFATQT